MSITVHEALKLDRLRNFRLVAGNSGLENKIERVGILDYEFVDKIEGQFAKGEFIISSFFFARDDASLVAEAVKELVETGVSGLAIKNIYYNELPAEAEEYANSKNFPIFIFDNSVFFEDIITDIMSAIKSMDNYQLLETKADLIINRKISKAMIRELALEINNSFRENVIAAFCRERKYIDDGNIIRLLERYKNSKTAKPDGVLFKYKNGLMVIFTYEKADEAKLQDFIAELSHNAGIGRDEYNIGISNCYPRLSELDKAINESIYAERVAEVTGSSLLLFRDIGIYQLLMPVIDEVWLHDFCSRIIMPLKSYDEKYHTEIFTTAVRYIENDGSIKAAAEQLFLHENTIRYRVNKMKEILGMEKLEGGFYEQLSAAVKIYGLLNKQ